MTKTSLLRLKNVSKFYYNKGLVASGFTKINLELNLGEFVVITGESGSGKSTLLHVLSGLDTYEEGEMYINGEETSHYGEEDFEKYRKTYIGNIFQSFNLVNSYTVYQNIELVLLLNGYKKKDIKDKINDLIEKVGLTKYKRTRVSKLSGGQKQRVAIARALAKDTPIIIADEPTGNLDSKSAESVIKLLAEIAKDKLVIIVTHNYEQVEKYATRKLEMHDGKLREDICLKETKEFEPKIYEYKDLTFFNKIRLGLRNTFNIFGKFILMFLVFLFVVSSFLGEYAALKQTEYDETLGGYNTYFTNTDPTRIVVNKNDKTPISEEDFNIIKNINHVSSITKTDTLLDTEYELSAELNDNEYFYFYGSFKNVNTIDKVDVGRLPENENEIVISGNKYDYYTTSAAEKINEIEVETRSYNTGYKLDIQKLTIVGIIYESDIDNYNFTFYVKENVLEKLRMNANEGYSTGKFTINGNDYQFGGYSEYTVIPNERVPEGEVYVPSDMNYLCKYEWCKNKSFDISIETIYYKENLKLTITDMYTKYNYKKLTGRKDFDDIYNTVFISYEDYYKLYDKETYQSSVFVDDSRNVEEVQSALENLGYKTLAMKTSLSNELASILAIFKIFRVIVIVGEFIFLFFIAYFVIKLIQKSKNVYYATVRILGGSKKIINTLIRNELLIVFHIAFALVVGLLMLIKYDIITIEYLNTIISFLKVYDYIFIYLVLLVMDLLIANRYSRKLFKSSAMKSYREEV